MLLLMKQYFNIIFKWFYSSELNYNWITTSFSEGSFRSLGRAKTTKPKNDKRKAQQEVEDSDAEADVESGQPSVFTCPQDGCVRVFLRHASLEKHLSLEKCTRSLERHSLLDLAKLGYQSRLEAGVGTIPTLSSNITEQSNVNTTNEGWALRANKKSYRFSYNQKRYLDAKFEIGRATGRKLNGEEVAPQMRRAQGPNGERLFRVSEFLSPQQITSYFSRLAAKQKRGAPVDDHDLCAYEEEGNFAEARMMALERIQLEHPICYDQYNICSMVADDKLNLLKLTMLQNICRGLELGVPTKDVRKKAVYINLLKDASAMCPCQTDSPC